MALKSKHQKQVAQPDQFVTKSMYAVSWVETNRTRVLAAIALALVLGVAWVAWGGYAQKRRAAVTRTVSAVLEAEAAEVVAEPPPLPEGMEEEQRPLTFRTEKQRNETLVRRYKRLLAAGGSTELTAFAHLGLGGVYASLGKHQDAQKEYQAVLDASVDTLAPYALEGMMYVLEARGKKREALAKIDELKTIQDGKFKNLATYHAARLEIAEGRKTQAIDMLRRLQRDLAETPELAYLREQTMALISQLESEGIVGAGAVGRDDEEDQPPRGRGKTSKAKRGGERETEDEQ